MRESPASARVFEVNCPAGGCMWTPKALGLVLTLAAVVSAQAPVKHWSSSKEYDLGSQAMAEPNPQERIRLLRDWIAQYPQTEFQRERLLAFASACQQSGNPSEALKYAAQVLELNGNDPAVLLFI